MSCEHCHTPRPADARAKGWRGQYCGACTARWYKAGRPADGPPPARRRRPRLVRVPSRRWVSRLGRIEDYRELRADLGEPLEVAARRLGVSVRTAQRYEAEVMATSLVGGWFPEAAGLERKEAAA